MAQLRYYVHGHGRGHASRALVTTAALKAAGHDVYLFAGGDALDLLADFPYALRAPLRPGWRSPWQLARRGLNDWRDLRQDPPDLILSDGDQAPFLAALSCRLPTVALGHDLVFSECELPVGLPLAGLAYQRANGMIPARLANARVAVHFLPAEPRRAGTYVVRPDTPAAAIHKDAEDGSVLCYLSENKGYDAATAAIRAGATVIGFGHVPPPEHPDIPWLAPNRNAFLRHLQRCRAVIASAGSTLLAECVLLGKPVFALYDPAHREQMLNALLAEHAGVAVSGPIGQTNLVTMRRFLDRVRQRDFHAVDLAAHLLPLSEVIPGVVRDTIRLW